MLAHCLGALVGIDAGKALRVLCAARGVATRYRLKESQRLRLKFIRHARAGQPSGGDMRRQVKPDRQLGLQ